MPAPATYDACTCCEEGCTPCCYVCCCSCLAYKDAIEMVGGPVDKDWASKSALNIDDPSLILGIQCLGVAFFAPLEWIALKSTSEIVGDRAGVVGFDHCIYSCPLVACLTCHPCTVYNTAKKYQRKEVSSPGNEAVVRE